MLRGGITQFYFSRLLDWFQFIINKILSFHYHNSLSFHSCQCTIGYPTDSAAAAV